MTERLFDLALRCPMVPPLALSGIDYVTRRFKCRDEDMLAFLIIALSCKMERGDVCIRCTDASLQDVSSGFARYARHAGDSGRAPELRKDVEDLISALQDVRGRFKAGDIPHLSEAIGAAGDEKPLIYDHGRLYLRRYFVYEQEVAAFVRHSRDQGGSKLPDFDQAAKALRLLFPEHLVDGRPNLQKVEAAMPLLAMFVIISGGPGTGKTSPVLKILLLLAAMRPGSGTIKLCAPTGKAAARMSESIVDQLNSRSEEYLELQRELADCCGCAGTDLLELIPRSAQTVHSLLKVVPHKVTPLVNRDRPLNCDILVVDEVSMVDLSLFAKIIRALDERTTVIMLGDKDQLCSVEAGSVLGDICARLSGVVSAGRLSELSALTGYTAAELSDVGLSDYAVLLQKSYRFDAKSGIGVLAGTVNRLPHGKDQAETAALLEQREQDALAAMEKFPDVRRLCGILDGIDSETKIQVKKQKAVWDRLATLCLEGEGAGSGAITGYREYLDAMQRIDFTVHSASEVKEIFDAMNRFRVLTSNHTGLLGDRAINRALEERVRAEFKLGTGEYFAGRIVLITRNDATANIHNGDVGFVAFEQEPGWSRRRMFLYIPSDNDKGFIRISPTLISHAESGFAMSIHKSQGSEYEQVLTVLALDTNPVLSKELVYTAITRAKKLHVLLSTDESFKYALGRSVNRESGLTDRIFAPD